LTKLAHLPLALGDVLKFPKRAELAGLHDARSAARSCLILSLLASGCCAQ
jgi:hypothetical protein